MSFNFSDKEMVLDICGKTYSVDPFSGDFMECLQTYGDTLAAITREETPGTSQAIGRMCLAVGGFIDSVLGKSAYDEIMCGRKGDFLAHQELMNYLLSSLADFRSALFDASMNVVLEDTLGIKNESETIH